MTTAPAFTQEDAGEEERRRGEPGGGDASNLRFLDVSTCGLLDTEIDHILERFPVLEHLVMDRCATMGNGLGPAPVSASVPVSVGRVMGGQSRGSGSEWVSLGRRCALVGVRRAKEREKVIKVIQAHIQAQMQGQGVGVAVGQAQGQAQGHGAPQVMNTGRRPGAKPGRKGLSTATISLREDSIGVNALASVPVMSSMPSPSQTTTSEWETTTTMNLTDRMSRSRIRILPPPPSLRSLCLTVPFVGGEKEGYHDSLRREFGVGWKEGLASLEVIRGRMRRMAVGVHISGEAITTRTMKFVGSGGYSGWLEGLEDLSRENSDGVVRDELWDVPVPVLCFAGLEEEGGGGHENGCGHLFRVD